MSRARPHTYTPKHRRPDRTAERASRLVAPAVFSAAVVGTVAAAQLSTGASGSTRLDLGDAAASAASELDPLQRAASLSRTLDRPSRSGVRVVSTAKRVTLAPAAVDHKYATALLNVWAGPGEQTPRVGLVRWGTRLPVTGQVQGGWAEVLLEADRKGGEVKVARWVNRRYLADEKPKPVKTTTESASPRDSVSESGSDSTGSGSTGSGSTGSGSTGSGSGSGGSAAPSTGLSTAPCPDGSATESGLTSGAVGLYRAVCAAFPALSSYGGLDAHGEHVDGRAIDFMITDSALGQAVADWVHANAGALGVRDIIWAQHIWTPERSSEGWRYMPDRGSPTANHYDHVHVAVY